MHVYGGRQHLLMMVSTCDREPPLQLPQLADIDRGIVGVRWTLLSRVLVFVACYVWAAVAAAEDDVQPDVVIFVSPRSSPSSLPSPSPRLYLIITPEALFLPASALETTEPYPPFNDLMTRIPVPSAAIEEIPELSPAIDNMMTTAPVVSATVGPIQHNSSDFDSDIEFAVTEETPEPSPLTNDILKPVTEVTTTRLPLPHKVPDAETDSDSVFMTPLPDVGAEAGSSKEGRTEDIEGARTASKNLAVIGGVLIGIAALVALIFAVFFGVTHTPYRPLVIGASLSDVSMDWNGAQRPSSRTSVYSFFSARGRESSRRYEARSLEMNRRRHGRSEHSEPESIETTRRRTAAENNSGAETIQIQEPLPVYATPLSSKFPFSYR